MANEMANAVFKQYKLLNPESIPESERAPSLQSREEPSNERK